MCILKAAHCMLFHLHSYTKILCMYGVKRLECLMILNIEHRQWCKWTPTLSHWCSIEAVRHYRRMLTLYSGHKSRSIKVSKYRCKATNKYGCPLPSLVTRDRPLINGQLQ